MLKLSQENSYSPKSRYSDMPKLQNKISDILADAESS